MKQVVLSAIVVGLSGCMGFADYLGPPPEASGSGAKAIDPEDLRVDPGAYPTFRVAKATVPPQPSPEIDRNAIRRIPMVQLLPSDEWRVTHKWGDLFLITSESYIQRQCESEKNLPRWNTNCFKGPFSSSYTPRYLHAIYVNKDGRVSGGWKSLANPRMIGLSSDRKDYYNPSETGNIGWEGVKFEIVR
jgi:hypothetical protein